MDRGAVVTALRWLARGDWGSAVLSEIVVVDGTLSLAPAGQGRVARRGVAVVPAGRPDPDELESPGWNGWHRVAVRLAEPAPAGAWLRIWTRVEAGAVAPAPPEPATAIPDDGPVDTPPGVWRAAAMDALDAWVLCRTAGDLWIAVELGGSGDGSPIVADLRVEAGDDGPVRSLPVAYRALPDEGGTDDGDGVLGRLLGLLMAELDETTGVLEELPALLSPAVAPDREDAPWLERLATWVALDLRDNDPSRRESVARAVERHAARGTREGIADEVRRETGIDVEIVEPIQSASVWRLDGSTATSALGLSTGLLDADPGPPVLDATAILDGSLLIGEEDAGLAVHARRAHRICVHVPDGSAEDVAAVDAVVQRERPAHVLARTCAIAHVTAMPTIVGVDKIPPRGPRGLANDTAHRADVVGVGIRIGEARLPGDTHPTEREGDAR